MDSTEGDYVPLDQIIMAELAADYRRQLTAECMLGKKGEYYDGEEWERLADYWDGRCNAAEALLYAQLFGAG